MWKWLILLVCAGCETDQPPAYTGGGEQGADAYWRPVDPPPGVHDVRCWVWVNKPRSETAYGGPQCFVIGRVTAQ